MTDIVHAWRRESDVGQIRRRRWRTVFACSGRSIVLSTLLPAKSEHRRESSDCSSARKYLRKYRAEMQRERTHRLSDVREESASTCHGSVIDAFNFPSSHSLRQSSISELSLFSSLHRHEKLLRHSRLSRVAQRIWAKNIEATLNCPSKVLSTADGNHHFLSIHLSIECPTDERISKLVTHHRISLSQLIR